MVPLHDLFTGQADQLAKLTDEGRRRALRLTREKLRELRVKLYSLEAGTWDYMARQAVLQSLEELVAVLTRGQVALLQARTRRAWVRGAQGLAVLLGQMDHAFLGHSAPLRWDVLAWYVDNAEKYSQVRLRVFETSLARYGAGAVTQVENTLAKSILVGEGWADARPKVWRAVQGVVGGRQWMVDRIIATETSAAYNGARLEAMLVEDQYTPRPADRLQKKLVATFDKRTGKDSVILHGQTVPVASPFVDSITGKHYMAPPNRPRDREVVVPWRESYTLDLGQTYDRDTAQEVDTGRDMTATRRGVIRGELASRRDQLVRLRALAKGTQNASVASAAAGQLANVERQVGLLETQLRAL
jgi:hypothetical protein